MSALDELKNKKGQPTELELCILMAGSLESPEDAAAELLALRERVAKLEKVEECAEKLVALRGVAHGAWVIEELEAALKSQ